MENNVEELKEFWTEKYAPKNLDEMVLTDKLRDNFKSIINAKTRVNFLFSGQPGIGKTTIVKMMAKELNASVLFIQCGIEGTVSVAQTKIKNFCDSLSIDGKPKVVILDELDSASGSGESSFQKTLRNIITESPDTCFWGTCNYPEKVIDALRLSRLGVTKLEFTAKDLLVRIKTILDSEKITYTRDTLKRFIQTAIKKNYPDIRRIISLLQISCSSGELVVSDSLVNSSSNENFLSDIIDRIKTSKNLLDLRQYYISNKSKISDYKEFSGLLFNYVLDNNMIVNPDMVLRMSNIIYQMNIVIDPEIQFFALITILNKELKNGKQKD